MDKPKPFISPEVTKYLRDAFVVSPKLLKDLKDLHRVQGQIELIEHLEHLVRTQKGSNIKR